MIVDWILPDITMMGWVYMRTRRTMRTTLKPTIKRLSSVCLFRLVQHTPISPLIENDHADNADQNNYFFLGRLLLWLCGQLGSVIALDS